MTRPQEPRPLPEEALDRAIAFVEGPMNRVAERAMKSRLLLAPVGLGWTLFCRSYLAVRDGDPTRLWRRPRRQEGAQ